MVDRPELNDVAGEEEFRRWYWTMAELQPFARCLGVRAAGPKAALVERIAARLGGRPNPKEAKRRRSGVQLPESLSRATQIPQGQRSSDELREFFEAEIGQGFRFNGHMRAFLLAGDATLGDAVTHWYATVETELPKQSRSLEFNRFTKEWHQVHPEGSAKECRSAWKLHRSLPRDEQQEVG